MTDEKDKIIFNGLKLISNSINNLADKINILADSISNDEPLNYTLGRALNEIAESINSIQEFKI